MKKKYYIFLLIFIFFIIYIIFQKYIYYKVENNYKVKSSHNINVLQKCKLTYPNSKTKVANYGKLENYQSNFFYINKYGDLVFILIKNKGDGKIRNELREGINGKDLGWNIHNKEVHYLLANVKLVKIKFLEEYTFLQIHSEENPLLRIIVKKDRNGVLNHIWAVIRINSKKIGKRANWYDLGEVNNNIFTKIEIYAGNDKLIIKKDNKLFINKDISYWTENKNYFKAGIYDSKNSKGPWNIKILFHDLYMN